MMQNASPPLTYFDAGVDIDAGEQLIERIKPMAASTKINGAKGELGGFGGMFDLQACGMSDPVLIAGTDGVGTKLEIAQTMKQHNGLGIDLVAMCVNDVLAQGAKPLFFLDYLATGHLCLDVAEQVIAGIANGCRQAGCALIGGETAEMPGLYAKGKYDLAGFCVGAVERDAMLSPQNVQIGDVVIALPSAGVHANGFSLIRKLIERDGYDLFEKPPFLAEAGASLGEILLTPTVIYAKAVQVALAQGGVHAICHVTGGGLIENPPRVFGEEMALRLDLRHSALPPLFKWLKQISGLSVFEMARLFNCGIGMLLTIRADKLDDTCNALKQAGEAHWVAGEMVRREDEAVRLIAWESEEG